MVVWIFCFIFVLSIKTNTMLDTISEYRHILKGSEVAIEKGKELTKHISLPDGLAFSDALLFQIGMNERPISHAVEVARELNEWKNQ